MSKQSSEQRAAKSLWLLRIDGSTKRVASDLILDDDGHSWRKYGQKEIQGARYPKYDTKSCLVIVIDVLCLWSRRSYYRCTHKRETGCLATKYVQPSDDDPFLVHVTYRGHHTCHQQRHQQSACSLVLSPHPLNFGLVNSACLTVNSACLTMNSDGGLQLGPSGPTLSTALPSPTAKSEDVLSEHELDFVLDNCPDIDHASLFEDLLELC